MKLRSIKADRNFSVIAHRSFRERYGGSRDIETAPALRRWFMIIMTPSRKRGALSVASRLSVSLSVLYLPLTQKRRTEKFGFGRQLHRLCKFEV